MGFCVFIHRADSIYDDAPAERYQFPARYLKSVNECVQNWVIYLEPRKVPDTRGYFAVARVEKIIPDPSVANMYLAIIEPGSYMEFLSPVAFNDASGPVEGGLLNQHGKLSGRAQLAVRPISVTDFERIFDLGFNEPDIELPRLDQAPSQQDHNGLGEETTPFLFDQERVRIKQLGSRIVRDRLFRNLVLKAYNKRCAITGLKLINGGGRAEVDAAHIKPVNANGPDILSNGIALSGTCHWMFDRGLISLSDDFEILVSRQVNDPQSVYGMINDTGRAFVPDKPREQPNPLFLRWHRENCFKI